MKKITKNFIFIGAAAMAITPLITVVSCGNGGSTGDGLDGLEVLSPALSKLESDLDKTVEDYLVSPSSNENGINTLTMNKLEESEKGTATEVTTLSKVFTLYTQDELDALATPPIVGSTNLITEEDLTNALLEYNKQINTEIRAGFQSEIQDFLDNNVQPTLTLMNYEKNFRYSYTFNKDARTLEFHFYQFEEHETDLTKFADKFIADPSVGVKALTKTQMENLYTGQSFEFFNGGGVLGWEWMNKQYHLNGNYLENDAKPVTASTIDPTHYKSDFDTFLTNFNGENVINTRWLPSAIGQNSNPTLDEKIESRNLDRDYQKFDDEDTDTVKDIIITTKSKPDLMDQKLYIEFTFWKNGEIDDTTSPYRTWVKEAANGHTEKVVRLIEIPDAVPSGVDTKDYQNDRSQFNKALNQVVSLLSIGAVGDLINNFLLVNQSELKPFVQGIAESVSFINYGYNHRIEQRGTVLNRHDEEVSDKFTVGSGFPADPIAAEFQHDLYDAICDNEKTSMQYVLNVGSIVEKWINDAGGFGRILTNPTAFAQSIKGSITNMTTSDQAALLSIGYALYFEHDFIINWKPDNQPTFDSGWTNEAPVATMPDDVQP